MWSDRTVLITGGTGFLGVNLAHRLRQIGADVHLLARDLSSKWRQSAVTDLPLHRLDIRDRSGVRSLIRALRPAVVFHLAVPGGHPGDPESRLEQWTTSVVGTAYLLEACREVSVEALVHVGGSTEYGPRPRPLRESDPIRPNTFRGVAKGAATLLCRWWGQQGLPVVILRPFHIYGPWEDLKRLVPRAILAALTGSTLPLTQPGFRRDFVYVQDVVEVCLIAAAQAPKHRGQIFNVGTGQQWTNEEVVETVSDVIGRPVRVRTGAYPPHPSDTRHWVADPRKSARRLGWYARVALREGLAETVAWVRTHWDLIIATIRNSETRRYPR